MYWHPHLQYGCIWSKEVIKAKLSDKGGALIHWIRVLIRRDITELTELSLSISLSFSFLFLLPRARAEGRPRDWMLSYLNLGLPGFRNVKINFCCCDSLSRLIYTWCNKSKKKKALSSWYSTMTFLKNQAFLAKMSNIMGSSGDRALPNLGGKS